MTSLRHGGYGEYGTVYTRPPIENHQRRRRVVQAGLGAALALVCVAVAVSQWDSSRGRAELVTQGAPGETNPSAIDDYCDLFSDPAECRAQRPKGKEAYWTHDEVKNELWRTMKALAELELREAAHASSHAAAQQDQKNVFEGFRTTISKEATDIHDLQTEMHESHTAAFKDLANELTAAAASLHNYTDTGLVGVRGRVGTLTVEEEEDRKKVLAHIATHVAALQQRVGDLHAEAMKGAEAVRAQAQGVEKNVSVSDARLEAEVRGVDASVKALDAAEQQHFAGLVAALDAAAAAQERDRTSVQSRLSSAVSDLYHTLSTNLAADKADIRGKLGVATGALHAKIAGVNETDSARTGALTDKIAVLLASQSENNAQQEAEIGRLRAEFESDKSEAGRRLSLADGRISAAFASLEAARARLATELSSDRREIQERIDTNATALDARAKALKTWAGEKLDAARTSVASTKAGLTASAARLKASEAANMQAVAAKKAADLAGVNASFTARLVSDGEALASRLASAVALAIGEATSLAHTVSSEHDARQGKFESMHTLQDKSNAEQAAALADLKRDASLEKAISAARALALSGNMSKAISTLAAVRAEIASVQDTDRAAIKTEVSSAVRDVTAELSGSLKRKADAAREGLRSKAAALSAQVAALVVSSDTEAEAALQRVEDMRTAQFRQDKAEQRWADRVNASRREDVAAAQQGMSEVLANLDSEGAKLTAELAKVEQERGVDALAATTQVDSKVAAEQAALEQRVDESSASLRTELQSAMARLSASLAAAEQKEAGDFASLDTTFDTWAANQAALERQQGARLDGLEAAGTSYVHTISSETATLRALLDAADTRLTKSGELLDVFQRETAHATNKTMSDEVGAVRSAVSAQLAAAAGALKSRLATRFQGFRVRVDSLQAQAKDAAGSVQASTEALGLELSRRAKSRAQVIDEERVAMAAAHARTRAAIKALGDDVATERSALEAAVKGAALAESRVRSSLKRDVRASVAQSIHNLTLALAASEGVLHLKLVHEVHIWSSALASNTAAAAEASAKAAARLEALAKGTTAQRQAMALAIGRLKGGFDESEDAASEAVSAIKQGIADAEKELGDTGRLLKDEQAGGKAETAARITKGLDALRANYSLALGAQEEAMRNTVADRTDRIAAREGRLEADIATRKAALEAALAAYKTTQERQQKKDAARLAAFTLASQQADTALDAALQDLSVRLTRARGSFQTAADRLSSAGNSAIDELHAMLDRAILALQGASTTLKSDQKGRVERAQLAVTSVREAVTAAQGDLRQMHAEDTTELRKILAVALADLRSSVGTKLAAAEAAARTALAARLAAAEQGVAAASAKEAQVARDAEMRISQLEETEKSNDAAQERRIAALGASQASGEEVAAARAASLAANTTALVVQLRSIWGALDASREGDKTTILAKIAADVNAARASLRSQVEGTANTLLAESEKSIAEKEAELAAERAAQKQTLLELTTEVNKDRSGETHTLSKDTGALATLWDRLTRDETFSHGNYTWLAAATKRMSEAIGRERDSEQSEEQTDLAAFKAAQMAGQTELRANFSRALAAEKDSMLAEGKAAVAGVDASVRGSFESARGGYQGAKDKLDSLETAQKDVLAENTRTVAAFNSSSDAWATTVETDLAAVKRELAAADTSQLNEARTGRASQQSLRQTVQGLLSASSALATLQTQVENAKRTAAQQVEATTAYTPSGDRGRKVVESVSSWTTEVGEALARILAETKAETNTRQTAQNTTAVELAIARARMNLFEQRLDAAEERAAAPPPPFVPPPAPPREPEPARPPVPQGDAPPPMPINVWEHKTASEGVDVAFAEATGQVRMGGSTGTASLSGTVSLPAGGKWHVYLAVYAGNRGTKEDTVTVSFNGVEAGTFNNDARGGFPERGGRPLNTKGQYVAMGEIEGDHINFVTKETHTHVNFKVEWKSANPSADSHMWVAGGEATYLGFTAPVSTDDKGPGGPAKVDVKVTGATDGSDLKEGDLETDGMRSRALRLTQNARLTILEGRNAIWQGPVTSRTTLFLPADKKFACLVDMPGYMSFFDPDCETKSKEWVFSLSPILPPGTARVVLLWGAEPKDLDVYMLAPHAVEGQEACEVNYRKKMCHSRSVRLDKDDTNGHGPETITIEKFNAGQYVLRVNEFHGDASNPKWGVSQAQVAFYSPHLGMVRYQVGIDGYTEGEVWYVLAIDGTTRTPSPCTRETCTLRDAPDPQRPRRRRRAVSRRRGSVLARWLRQRAR